MRPERLSSEERAAALMLLSDWREVPGRDAITRRYVFRSFRAAFGFLSEVALEAESRDHHPEWFNVHRTVDVTLSTHDAGGLTQLDVDLARTMDQIAVGRLAGS